MPVQEFECQIARSQIGRYLNGEGLSSEGLRQLGAHVAECTECKGFLDHRKAALQGMLGEAPLPPREEVRAVVDLKPAEALLAQLKAKVVETEPAPVAAVSVAEPGSSAVKATKPLITKPLMYCGGLAIVLIAMTYISRNPTSLLGPKASNQLVAENSSKPSAPAATDKPEKAEAQATEKPADSAKPETTASDSAKPNPVKTDSALTSTETKPDAAVQDKPADDGKVQITPDTKASKAPLSVDEAANTEQNQATNTTPVESKPAAPKPHAPTKTNRIANGKPHATRWARKGKWRRHSYSYLHLKAGSAAIHVYANSN